MATAARLGSATSSWRQWRRAAGGGQVVHEGGGQAAQDRAGGHVRQNDLPQPLQKAAFMVAPNSSHTPVPHLAR
jgi:hypothetical protein